MTQNTTDTAFNRQDGNEELWHQVFQVGHPVLAQKQRRYQMIPGKPRCHLCYAPMGGLGGWLMRFAKLRPSARNPNYCNACDGFLAAFPGGADVDLSMLFCDLRGSVELSSKMSPREFTQLIMRMRAIVLEKLWKHDGFVLQFQGDSVIGVWPPGFVGPDHAKKAVAAAREIADALAQERDKGQEIPAGIGVHTDTVYLCTVASANGALQEISAFGEGVNIAARLSAVAGAGEVFLSEAIISAAELAGQGIEVQDFTLKGIDRHVRAARLAGGRH